jgi:opacity protein-like surface antigen
MKVFKKMTQLKNEFLLTALFLCLIINFSVAQENSITLSGGYSFTNIENIDEGTSGWRINALYEYTPMGGNVSHGLSFGYVQTEATVSETVFGTSEFKAGHWPIYYAPKYTFLESTSSFRPFIKGAIGFHISDYDKTGPLGGEIDTGDSGFYGGAGAGINIRISDLVLVNLEYEWAWLSNSWYVDGFLNSAMLGVSMKF